MLIHLICAARPNFMKIAPLFHALKKEKWAATKIVHTGQHYDINMSDSIFKDLQLPDPHIHLGIGSGTHAEQSGNVMIAYEKILMEEQPDLIVVVGDVNSTMACTIAASKITYPQNSKLLPREIHDNDREADFTGATLPSNRPLIAHLEAGLRSFDRTMPEEINRLVTDSLANILWTPSTDGNENLIREGISGDKIKFVGNIMIDALEMRRDKIEKLRTYKEFNLEKNGYGLVTLHRPSNVDKPGKLKQLCEVLINISRKMQLVFPVHPRTRKNLEKQGLMDVIGNIDTLHLPEPLSYTQFMNMVFNCRFVITDSGGIQEETTYLGITCLTVRPNTERPITVTKGTNVLSNIKDLENHVIKILSVTKNKKAKIDLWDGSTSERIVEHLKQIRKSVL